MLTSYLGTNLLKHKNCSGSRIAIWVSNYKIRYIFILFFAWMNYVSGSVIMVLINQIISVITAVFLVFPCLLLPTGFFPPLSYPNYSFKLLKRYMTFYLAFFSVPISMVTIWDSLSTFLIQWFPAESLKIGGAQNNRRFLLLFLPKSGGGHLPPFLQHTRFRRHYWIV